MDRWILGLCLGCWMSLAGNQHASMGQEWPRFRGANGAGVSLDSTIPTKLTKDQILWSQQLPAAGHSSPVLWGKVLFLTGADDEKTASRSLFAIQVDTGEVLWKRETPTEQHVKHQFNSFASSTPVVDSERIYTIWHSPSQIRVEALSHRGEEIWKRDLGPHVSRHSAGSSPIVYEDLVILSGEQDEEGGGKSFLIGLDSRTGETRWKIDRKSKWVPYATPILFERAGEAAQVLFSSTPHGITGLNPKTGGQLWEMPDLLDKRTVGSGIILQEKWVTATCGSGGGGMYMVIVEPGDGMKTPPRLIRKQEDQIPYVPSPIAKGNLMFLWGDKGIVSCIEIETGKTVWQKRIGGNFFSSPVIAGEALYNVSTTGEVVVLSAGEEYAELSRYDLGGQCHSTPAVADGKLFVRTYNRLHAIGRPQVATAQ